MKTRVLLVLIVVSSSWPSVTKAQDLKVVVRKRVSVPDDMGFREQKVVYLKDGQFQRVESRLVGGHAEVSALEPSITLYRCSANEVIELDEKERRYTLGSLPKPVSAQHPSQGMQTVLIERRTVDTGEQKTLFGRQARRMITTVRRTPQGATSPTGEETIDAWYLDVTPPAECGHAELFRRPPMLGGSYEASDVYRVTEDGPELRGYPVVGKVTSNSLVWKPGRGLLPITTTYEWEFIEFSEEALSPALFNVPPGFRRVRELR